MDGEGRQLRFSWQEFSGSLGDLGTFLPLVVAATIACDLDLGAVLVLAGLMNVATGVLFGQPIPVQPMKALAAIAITERITHADLTAAGLSIGIVLVGLAGFGMVNRLGRLVPRAVVRGIQLGVGMKLVLQALEWIADLDPRAWAIAAIAGLALVPAHRSRMPLLVAVFAAGFVLLWWDDPAVYAGIGIAWPRFGAPMPSPSAWATGVWRGALPQLPLTLLNSVVAVCALSSDYFPGRGVPQRHMAMSVGLMNLVSVPLGGIPMCHGAGGLAAQYRFGARTGGSVIMLGLLKIAVGLAFGATMIAGLDAYPRSILAVLLAFAGVTLGSTARDSLRGRPSIVVLATAVPIVALDTLTGFLVGLAAALVVRRAA
jgi:MFS superfamily sulfate permease-like transporter